MDSQNGGIIDTRELNVFKIVYEARGLSQAAKELYLSPQACSKTIQKLETELGAQLFSRTHFGMVATPQGDALYRQVQAINDILEGIHSEIDAVQQRSTLLIASTQGMQEYLTRAFLQDFSARHPHIAPRIMESPDTIAKERLRNNAVELAILGGPIDLSIYRCIPFTKHRPCLVINRVNPLAQKKYIAFKDLDCQPLALVGREFASYHLIINRLMRENVSLNIVMEATELDYCHRLAAENEAIALSFDFGAWAHQYQETVILPFEDSLFLWETYLAYRAGTNLSSQAQVFCDFATNWIREYADDLFKWPT